MSTIDWNKIKPPKKKEFIDALGAQFDALARLALLSGLTLPAYLEGAKMVYKYWQWIESIESDD